MATDGTITCDPQRLTQLLREQCNLYGRLHDLSQRQKNLISGDRPELLLDVLGERQSLILSLSRINEELSEYRSDWARVYEALPEETQRETSGLLDEINGTLKAILDSDQQDGALLAARKQLVSRSLGDLSGGRVANSAYAPSRLDYGDGADFAG